MYVDEFIVGGTEQKSLSEENHFMAILVLVGVRMSVSQVWRALKAITILLSDHCLGFIYRVMAKVKETKWPKYQVLTHCYL